MGCLFFSSHDTLSERTGLEAFRWNGLVERSFSGRTAGQNGWMEISFSGCSPVRTAERDLSGIKLDKVRDISILVEMPQKSGSKSILLKIEFLIHNGYHTACDDVTEH